MAEKKLVVIVGSTHGIGLATTKKFLECGWRVIGCARGTKDKRGEEMEKNFKNYKHFNLDISDEAAVKNFFSYVDSPPSVVLICAGIGIAPTAINNFSFADSQAVIDTNLLGSALVIKYALSVMQGGCIAVCGSVAAENPNTGADWSYSASKAGIIPLLNFVAQDKKFQNVAFLHLKLGFIKTRMTVNDDKIKWLLQTPYAKAGEPAEIAERIFLATQKVKHGYSEIELIGGDIPQNYPPPKITGRAAGVLMPVFSLPNFYDCGTFGSEARKFIRKISACGFKYWMLLPILPTGISNSPYSALSTFGGNINLISAEELYKDGLLSKKDIQNYRYLSPKIVDYSHAYESKPQMLQQAWKNFSRSQKNWTAFKNFCEKNSWWLEEFATYFAIKKVNGDRAWQEWDNPLLRDHNSATIKEFILQNEDAVNFWKFTQFIFFRQLEKLIAYANKYGICLIGDLPFYLAVDSVDVWANRKLFEINEDNTVKFYAGTPHSDDRHWGVAAYRWQEHMKDGFNWWRRRIRHWGKIFSGLRVDHATGITKNYIIPADGTAPYFKDAPCDFIIEAIKNEAARYGTVLFAEDLGVIPAGFREKLEKFGFMVMRIAQYAFQLKFGNSNIHLPSNYSKNTMCFTGTHDNKILNEYVSNLNGDDLKFAFFLTGAKTREELKEKIIQEIYFSRANFCTLPIQDVLGLGAESTMVFHEEIEKSWKWRLEDLSALDAVAQKMQALSILSGRLPGNKSDFLKMLEVLANERTKNFNNR